MEAEDVKLRVQHCDWLGAWDRSAGGGRARLLRHDETFYVG